MRSFPFVILCLTGFIYQAKVLIDDYLSGGTFVMLKVGPNDPTIPGVTLCTFDYYMFYSLQKNPDFNNFIMPFVKQLRKENLTKEVFSYKIGQLIQQYIMNQNVSDQYAIDIMANQSVIHGAIGLKLFVVGNIKDENGTEIRFNSMTTPELIPLRFETHIESMNFKGSPRIKPVKCFTFFSWKFEEFKKFKMQLAWIEFHIFPTQYWFYDIKFWREMWVSIHSPNTIPDFKIENFIKLDYDDYAKFSISSVNTKLLGKGFDTDCRDYGKKNINDTDYSKNECILDCLKKKMFDNCQTENFPTTEFLLTRKWLEQNPKMKIVNDDLCLKDVLSEYKGPCTNDCKDECNFKYYQYDHIIIWKQSPEEAYIPVKWPGNFDMAHHRMPDIHLNHLPQMTFTSLICNFGGLLGMWLGLSLLTISNELFKIFMNFVRNYLPAQNTIPSITIPAVIKVSVITSGSKENSAENINLKCSSDMILEDVV